MISGWLAISLFFLVHLVCLVVSKCGREARGPAGGAPSTPAPYRSSVISLRGGSSSAVQAR